MSAPQQTITWRLDGTIPANNKPTSSTLCDQISGTPSYLASQDPSINIDCFELEIYRFENDADVCSCHGVIGILMENFGEQGLRVICAAKGLVDKLVVILKKIGTKLAAGTGERMEVIKVEVMRERRDYAVNP